MTVAAAVTTFNRLGSLKRCIDAIRAQEHPVDEIVVVNDQSTDGTREWLDSQADLIAVHQPGNFGCASQLPHRAQDGLRARPRLRLGDGRRRLPAARSLAHPAGDRGRA